MRCQPKSPPRLVLAVAFLAWLPAVVQAQDEALVLVEPEKIKTAEACGECHVEENEVWKRTLHATGFKTLHRKESAEAIARKMGFKLIKRESLCLRCHYTPTIQNEQVRAISGVSCESCHGASRDWIDLHNDYGKGVTFADEPPEHKAERIAASVAAGMRRPSDLYPVVKSCFGCHTVPHEKLVNVGGHSVGSGAFELVAWSEKIRHNFLASQFGGSRENAERTAERRRVMYVVGRAVDLEEALRGVAQATEEAVYVKAMIRRVRLAVAEVRAVARRADLAEAKDMVAAVRGVRVGLGNRDALLAAADAVGDATRRFLSRHDGKILASLDNLVQGIDEGFEEEDDEEEIAPVLTEAPAAATSEPSTSAALAADASAGGPQTTARAAPAVDPGVPAVGEVKRKIRPPSSHATIGPGACSRCHTPQNAWWFNDPHYRSADAFFDEKPEKVKVARLYGLSSSKMLRGDQVCMDCHGTVTTGKERRAVQDGVSCESCHGPAADWLEPHQEGDKALGLERPGYVASLQLGKREMRDPEVRAENCTGCHYVTEPRLISAGHPSGADFDYVKAMGRGEGSIRHWEHETEPAVLQAAFEATLAKRGAVPKVRLARLPSSTPAPSAPTPPRAARKTTPTERAEAFRPRPQSPAIRSSSSSSSLPLPPAAEPPRRDVELPPFPELEGASVEEILLALKSRLELLYRTVYSGEEQP